MVQVIWSKEYTDPLPGVVLEEELQSMQKRGQICDR